MKNTEKKGLFELFGVEMPENISDVNLIGLDFGDGDICAMKVKLIPGSDNKIDISALYLDREHVSQKCANILYWPNDEDAEKKLGLLGDYENGTVYSNFKKCPGKREAKTRYTLEGGRKSPYTYEQIMQEAFCLAVEKLFSFNSEIDKEKRTILMVGRPSSPKWAENEKAYAALLKESLASKPFGKPIDVVIVPEALAAFSREVNPERMGQRRVKRGENVLIVDCGSSTFDVTLVMEEGIPDEGEYSRQLGGGKVEDCMLRLFFNEEKGHTRERLVNRYDKVYLRRMKEHYYGPNGYDGTRLGCYYVAFEGETEGEPFTVEKEIRDIDESFMEKALHSVPVTVESSSVFLPTKTYPSWYEACREVFLDAKKQLDKYLTKMEGNVPDRIIITGGASVMPPVRCLVEECFGRKPEVTDLPNYSVSEGLAYVGATEIRKNHELNATVARVEEIVSECVGDIEETVARYCATVAWNQIADSMKEWKDAPEDASLKEWFTVFERELKKANTGVDVNGQGLLGKVHQGLNHWYTKHEIEEKINRYLKERFETLFPDFRDAFNYRIDGNKVLSRLSEPKVTLVINYRKIFGWLKGWDITKKRTKFEREDSYLKARSRMMRTINDLTDMYREQLDIQDKTKEELMESLKPQLAGHVETMTPYFNMAG